MESLTSSRLVLLFAATTWALADATPAAGKLWVVADTGCPLVDFATIQEAVDAAADGDVILVRPRLGATAYAPFALDGKALALVADRRGPVLVSGLSTIRHLANGQSVLLQGFARIEALALRDNDGHAWIEDCRFGSPPFLSPPPVVATAVAVDGSDSVIFARCTMEGFSPAFSSVEGGMALLVVASKAHLHDCRVAGGDGYRATGRSSPGGDGGAGISVSGGVVFVSGTSVAGGDGGVGWWNLIECWNGGDGGNGLEVDAASTAFTLDATLAGGAGGAVSMCSQGSNGLGVSGAGARWPLPGSSRSFTSVSAVLEGEPLPLAFTGEAGDVALLLVSAAQRHLLFPGLHGTVGPELPGLAAIVGIVPPSSTLRPRATMPTGVVDPGEAAVVFAQGLFVSAGGLGFLGSTFAWVVLDAGHDPLDGCPPVVWVDDDAPGDPGPGSPLVSNPNESGTAAAPFDAIQEAIAATKTTGTTVLVRDGTYSGLGNALVSFLNRSVTVKSENGPAACTIAVTTPGTSAFFHAVDQTAPIRIEGFTVTGGTPAFDLDGEGLATIRGCVIRGNRQGVSLHFDSSAVIESTVIAGNTARYSGGGIECFGTALTLRNCMILDNRAGISGGGAIIMSAQAEIAGCTFAGNTATRAQALELAPAGLAPYDARVSNSVFWGNGPEEIRVSGRHPTLATLDLSYSDVMGGTAGVTVYQASLAWGPGNLNADPLFVSPATGDYHLMAGSPCIDAGDPRYLPQPGETDIDGQPRLRGAAVDLGADER